MTTKASGAILGACLLAAMLVPVFVTNSYVLHVLVLWLLFALLALSLNIIVGYVGELSFGHAAFFGLGAYASAIVTMQYGVSVIVGLLTAGLVAGTAGYGIGYVSLRIVGPQFAILTLGFGSIIYTVTNYWVDVTRGPMGINNIPALSLPVVGPLSEARGFYYVVLTALVAFGYVCHSLVSSRTGRAFLAVRENPQLAASIGIDVFKSKLLGFVMATVAAGVAGGLYAHYLRVITPELMGLQYVAALIIMVVVGGRGTIAGPIVGALIYVLLLELLRPFGPLRLAVFAALLTLSVIFLPNGLVSLAPRWLPRREDRTGALA
jgi:branched-chain amino acid transport system permease protein